MFIEAAIWALVLFGAMAALVVLSEIPVIRSERAEILSRLNRAYKCLNPRCGMISRTHQREDDMCPHCNTEGKSGNHNSSIWNEWRHTIQELDGNRDYPFAPKLTWKQYSYQMKQKETLEKQEKRHRDELKKLNADVEYLSHVDEQLEMWTKMELKKIENLDASEQRVLKE